MYISHNARIIKIIRAKFTGPQFPEIDLFVKLPRAVIT